MNKLPIKENFFLIFCLTFILNFLSIFNTFGQFSYAKLPNGISYKDYKKIESELTNRFFLKKLITIETNNLNLTKETVHIKQYDLLRKFNFLFNGYKLLIDSIVRDSIYNNMYFLYYNEYEFVHNDTNFYSITCDDCPSKISVNKIAKIIYYDYYKDIQFIKGDIFLSIKEDD